MQKGKGWLCLRHFCTLCKSFSKLWHITWHHYSFLFFPVVPSVPEIFFLIVVHYLFLAFWQTQTVYESATEVQPLDSTLLETSWNNHSIVQAPQNSLWWQMCVFKSPDVPLTKEYLEHNNYCLVWNPKGSSWSSGKVKVNSFVKCLWCLIKTQNITLFFFYILRL